MTAPLVVDTTSPHACAFAPDNAKRPGTRRGTRPL